VKHLVLFKFEKNYMSQELLMKAEEVFFLLKKELPDDITEVEVHENCVARDMNLELIVLMTLAGEESLDTYLNHPLHVALVKEWIPHIIQRVSFDYME